MRRTLIVVALAVATTAAIAGHAIAAPSPIVSPVADPYYHDGGLRGTKGFGQVEPSFIYYGGDPTGAVCRIRWVSWGGPVAHGFGAGWYVNSHESVAAGHLAVASVVASNLGTWNGRPAYNRLTWSFPDHGGQGLHTECF